MIFADLMGKNIIQVLIRTAFMLHEQDIFLLSPPLYSYSLLTSFYWIVGLSFTALKTTCMVDNLALCHM
ncbi:hypothetical protein PAJ35_09045, partial [Campylobacter jejuni]|nr:hypothetical protein [Campylobacter jejuni]